MITQEQLDVLNRACEPAWTITKCCVKDYDLPRDDYNRPLTPTKDSDFIRPFSRLVFSVDGFTQWDAVFVPQGVKILSNMCLGNHFEEDMAFDDFNRESIQSYKVIERRLRAYALINNLRARLGVTNIQFDRKKTVVSWREADQSRSRGLHHSIFM